VGSIGASGKYLNLRIKKCSVRRYRRTSCKEYLKKVGKVFMPKPVKLKRMYDRIKAVPWLRRLVASLSPRRPGFDCRSVRVGFVVDKVALGQVFFEYFGFPLSI
jgi:hypothetical protein